MLNNPLVQPVTSVRAASDTVGDAKTAALPSPPEREHAASSSPIPNPRLRLDAALGLVVLEFRSETGAITTSIPTERQLQAYQRWDATHFGPTPAGAPKQASAPERSLSKPKEPAATADDVMPSAPDKPPRPAPRPQGR